VAEPGRRVLPERLVLLEHLVLLERPVLPERRDVLESCRARRPRDAWQKAEYRLALRVVSVERVAPLQALLPLPQEQADESGLLQARSPQAPRASQPAAPLQV
jgi:hypothetical protein